MKYIPPEIRIKRAAAGRIGGYQTFFKYGRAQMRDWGRLGGRPRLKTLDEIMSRTDTIAKQNLTKRGKRITAALEPLLSSADSARC